jgi:hypothetical protein
MKALKNLLLSPDRSQPVAITTALADAGGFGKTTLAAALCHDEDIIDNFDDGILWVNLGQTPNVLGSLLTVYAALTGERPASQALKTQVSTRAEGGRTDLPAGDRRRVGS